MDQPASPNAPRPLESQIVLPTNGIKNRKQKRLAIAGGAVLILMFGLISALVLSKQSLNFFSSAWDCQNYTFSVSQHGVVAVHNGSTRNETVQRADVFINAQKIQTFDVPALNAGQSADLGTLTLASTAFSWEVRGTTECSNSGKYEFLSAKCLNITVYDNTWKKITDLTQLKAGDLIRIDVNGSSTSGTFTKARFTINGEQQPEVTTVSPTTNDYYMEYSIPSGITSFSFSAQLYHSTLNTWI